MEGIEKYKKILITGAFGYIGGRLGHYLTNQGYEVYLGTRFENRSLPSWTSIEKVVCTSWENSKKLYDISKNMDVIVHLAGMNASDCFKNPEKAIEFNGHNTRKLIETAKLAGVKKFIYLSTAHVYANPLLGTFSESSEPKNDHPYAVSHLEGENALIELSNNGNFQGNIVRLSNAFGPPADKAVDCWSLVVNDLCKQAIEKKILKLKTSGLQKRNFIPITDVCRAIGYFIISENSNYSSKIYNLGGISLSVFEMATLIQKCCLEVFGYSPEIRKPIVSVLPKSEVLKYKMDWLNKSNFSFETEIWEEIYSLLHFCRKSF